MRAVYLGRVADVMRQRQRGDKTHLLRNCNKATGKMISSSTKARFFMQGDCGSTPGCLHKAPQKQIRSSEGGAAAASALWCGGCVGPALTHARIHAVGSTDGACERGLWNHGGGFRPCREHPLPDAPEW